jgi:D-alanyl-D-alanine carboxypeptidase
MVIFMDDSIFRLRLGTSLTWRSLAALARLTLVLLVAAAIAASPAEARKKRGKRSHYSPPQAAMVVDLYSGKVLYAQNPDKPRFPASVTKVMTLYMLFEQIRDGHMSADTKLKVSAVAASRPPSKLGLKAGSTITANDAMYALVTKSANDVAAVIAENIAGSEAAFAQMMTRKAREIGMSKTTFRNASGLPDKAQVTTARDLITLGWRMLKDFPEEAKIFRTRYFKYGGKTFRNHNRLLFSYAGTEGMKTGFTRASGFNLLTSCRRDDKHLVAVVIGGRSSRQRNTRMQSLLNRSWPKAIAFNEWKQKGGAKPLAVAGVLQADHLPERNPAFHASASEALLKVAIAKASKDRAAADGDKRLSQLALAAAASAPRLARAEEPASVEIAEPEQGDTDKDVIPSDEAVFGPYHIQVGSYLNSSAAKSRLEAIAEKASGILDGHEELTVSGEVRGKSYYRARFGKFSRAAAARACAKLKRLSVDCLVVRVE